MTTLFAKKQNIINTLVAPMLRRAKETGELQDVPNLAENFLSAKVYHHPECDPEQEYWLSYIYQSGRTFRVWGTMVEIADVIAMTLIRAD